MGEIETNILLTAPVLYFGSMVCIPEGVPSSRRRISCRSGASTRIGALSPPSYFFAVRYEKVFAYRSILGSKHHASTV
jgi:hypothetical protein